jgi:predicted HTH transcriptional regulator
MMHLSTIQIIKRGEGIFIEFKRTIDNVHKIAKTIVSFANTSGGVLLVGVGDKGEIMGIDSELHQLQKLERIASHLIEEKIVLEVKTEIVDGKKILRIDIRESEAKPHFAINEKDERITYVRVKDKSVPVPKLLIQGETPVDVEKLLESRHVKTLVQFLREQDFVTAKMFSRMINISEKRSERMLNDLAGKHILLKNTRGKVELFSLKWAH